MSKVSHQSSQSNTLVQAIISRQALEHNLAKIRQCAGPSPIWGVVKANAYGHGVAQIVPAISQFVQGFACARLEEADEIIDLLNCQNSVHDAVMPILILGGCYEPSEFSYAQKCGFRLVVHTESQLEVLEKSRIQIFNHNQKLKLWLKINVGMNRLGLMSSQLLPILQRLKALSFVQVDGVLAHLGTADEPNHAETIHQMTTCRNIFSQVKQMNPQFMTSLSNSAHLLTSHQHRSLEYPWRGNSSDWVRPGICMYGASPFKDQDIQSLGLKPVMSLRAKIVSIRDIQKDRSVGYGATWTSHDAVRLFVVACGYGDGYPRHIENAIACINGIKLVQAGRVSMDFTVFQCPVSDLNQGNSPSIGDFVELWGEYISVDEVAKKSQSIGYERLTQLSRRVHYRLD